VLVGPDELRARQLLLEMQERLSRDPYDALGLKSSDAAEVRRAFLHLTKTYHPARFARMSPEIQRLSNEVFLGLRAAHDTMSRQQVKVPAPRSTGAIPIVRAPSASGRPPSGTLPTLRPTPSASPPAAPAATPPRAASGPVARTTTSPLAARPGAGSPPTATAPSPAARPSQPPASAQTTQPMRPMGNPPSRMPTSSPPPAMVPTPSGSARVPTTGARAAGAAGGGPDGDLVAVHQLLAEDRLSDARVRLEALVTRQPNVPAYQALIHYTKGREAQLARRIDEARVELMDALQLDPDLQLAKTALGELFTRRK
jgi:hypothetical protein